MLLHMNFAFSIHVNTIMKKYQLKNEYTNNCFKQLIAFVFCALLCFQCASQGDGPRSNLLSPKGLWGVNAKWINMNQNITPSGNILLKDADIKVNVFPIAVFHTFQIKGQLAQITALIVPGKTTGTLYAQNQSLSSSASGISDGFLGLKVGLIGAPALDLTSFAKKKPGFSMSGFLRVWYSGTYDADKVINMGTNRAAFQMMLPMSMPIGKNTAMPFWLEVVPAIEFYTTNNEPASYANADKATQQPVASVESHLTKNITPKFWAGIGIRYYYGGEQKLDGVPQDNVLNIASFGLGLGFQPLPMLSFNASYANVWWGYNNAQTRMWRIATVYTIFEKESKG